MIDGKTAKVKVRGNLTCGLHHCPAGEREGKVNSKKAKVKGRRQTADGRRQTADGRRQTADGKTTETHSLKVSLLSCSFGSRLPAASCRLPSAVCFALERLREAKLHLSAIQAKNRGRAIKAAARSSLRHEKLRRIQQVTKINRY